MDAEQLRILQYFEKSLGYWEMLVSVVACDEAETGVERQSRETTVAQVTPDGNAADTLPHPWTGISSLSSQLFGQAVRLCRVYRQGITNPTGRASSLLTAMQRIDEARNLEERILDLDFGSAAHLGDTGDTRTPRSHLVLVAEAYQLAALLQLYITFPDLVSLRLPHERNLNQAEDVPWNKWIVPLALRLVNVLEQIPPESGSRMMQPLLYICAGAGLRRDSSVAIDTAFSGLCILRPATPSGMKDGQVDMMAYVDQIDVGADEDATDEHTPGTAMDVDEARNFINARLDLLKRTLHPNPIIVTAQLLKAVWAAYDAEPAGSTSVHWFDVMEKTGLRSLFG
ncbi:C6 zinc finger domain containing protein [Emericellopsis cladophorae]|uniref:C6 zinc finger domain containing protein n=1 Tax=Emericellopsis cladophorae TaxID=2686198 RepID=A0A9Q0BHY4_9HYPO|nr:C6 zinc finger domain containing protein [Emericellopsis cladophorae]KAI6784939.1 C6 zinc finger domain containing protein [Emericellopsis cladophorae]